MREVKVLSELKGKIFGLKPETLGSIPVILAIEVTDFCSQDFVIKGNTAIIEFSSLDGDELLRLKTRFRGSGPNAGLSSIPCLYKAEEKDKLLKGLRYTSGQILDGWD